MAELEEREPGPNDLVHTPKSLADANGLERQAIDNAISHGKLKAYHYPNSRRVWILDSDVPARYRPSTDLQTRVARLESAVDDLTTLLSHRSEAPSQNRAGLLAENATLRAVNLLLLAEAADRDEHQNKQDEAFDLLRQAIDVKGQAHAALQRSWSKYRDALAQTQLPAVPPDASAE